MAESISLSEGLGFFASRAAADIICPTWQYPHCGTSISCHASCTGCVPSAESPSSVVTVWLPTAETGVWQDRTALPFRCTVHAPHWPMPQPYLVALRLRMSRRTHNKGVSPAASIMADLPFTFSLKAIARAPECKKIKIAEPRTAPRLYGVSGGPTIIYLLTGSVSPAAADCQASGVPNPSKWAT